MLIPGVPVKIKGLNKGVQQEILSCPFPFLSGAQTVLSCGREALYYGIKLLKHLPQRAHVPAYCCKSVLAPFKKLSIEINFYDVGKHLEPIIDKKSIKKGDLFLLIHYFGIPQDIHSIKQLCEKFSLILIEDCAHTLPDPQSSCPMGSTGVFSIYSLRKQLLVPDGGILVVNDNSLKERLSIIPKPKLKKVPLKKWLIMNFDKIAFFFGWPNTLKIKDALRDKISSTENIFYSSLLNEKVEISYLTLKVLSNVNFSEIVKIRKRNYYWLVDKLKDIDQLKIPFPILPDAAVPQAFPILVKKANYICAFMRKNGIGVDQWPGVELPKEVLSKFSGTFVWINSLILLPLHQDLKESHLKKIVKILKKSLKLCLK
ncbi:MAG: hypothetical protein DRP84_07940 [Spirochaetes bacterium]|nr:MAG: hypothetical protein DRP84_07940 [Spirochaetota bacterium]